MKILLTFNESYAPHAAAVITGLIEHASGPLSISILYTELKDDTINSIKNYYKEKLSSIDFHKVELDETFVNALLKVKGQKHLAGRIETYLRLFAQRYVNDDDVIYLDCDIVINGDIKRLMDEVCRDYYVCAVKEYDPYYKKTNLNNMNTWTTPHSYYNAFVRDALFTRFRQYCGQSIELPYLCAGIMYMNLKKWREDDLLDKILKAINEQKTFYFADQDLLNYVTCGRFGSLHPKWNHFVTYFGLTTGYTSDEIKEATINPMIIHMAGKDKPWSEGGGIYKQLYWNYRLRGPWPENKYNEQEKICNKALLFAKRLKHYIIKKTSNKKEESRTSSIEWEWNEIYIRE